MGKLLRSLLIITGVLLFSLAGLGRTVEKKHAAFSSTAKTSIHGHLRSSVDEPGDFELEAVHSHFGIGHQVKFKKSSLSTDHGSHLVITDTDHHSFSVYRPVQDIVQQYLLLLFPFHYFW